MAYVPSKVVEVPLLVPSINTVTPGKGLPPSSTTIPLTRIDWEYKKDENTNINTSSMFLKFILRNRFSLILNKNKTILSLDNNVCQILIHI